MIDRLIAGVSGPGAISILEAGDRVYGILAALSTIGLMSVLLTRLSQDAINGRLNDRWPAVLKLIGGWCMVWWIIGILIGVFAMAWWLKRFTTLDAAQTQMVHAVYWYYLAGLPAGIFSLAYVKRLQASRRFWVLTGAAAISVSLNIPASLLLRRLLGVPGIALATTLIAYLLCLILMATAHRRESR